MLASGVLGGDVTIQNILQIPPAQRPEWLQGAPVLLDARNRKAYQGGEVFKHLQMLAQARQSQAPAVSNIGAGFQNPDLPPFYDNPLYMSSGKLDPQQVAAQQEIYEKMRQQAFKNPQGIPEMSDAQRSAIVSSFIEG